MPTKVRIASKDGELATEEALFTLRSRRLFKTLSLRLADDAGIPVLASLLLLERNDQAVSEYLNTSALPIMMRMDYSLLPADKPLGGIPLYTTQTVAALVAGLQRLRLFPLLQPHISRFSDLFSVGIMFEKESMVASLEVVGRGFDAGDLRLGQSAPHETFQVDIDRGRVLAHRILDKEAYQRDRQQRLIRIAKWRTYIDLANRTHQLVSSLDKIKANYGDREEALVPEVYSCLPGPLLAQVLKYSKQLSRTVLGALPPSVSYVASFSFTNETGWIFWDIYGAWYSR